MSAALPCGAGVSLVATFKTLEPNSSLGCVEVEGSSSEVRPEEITEARNFSRDNFRSRGLRGIRRSEEVRSCKQEADHLWVSQLSNREVGSSLERMARNVRGMSVICRGVTKER